MGKGVFYIDAGDPNGFVLTAGPAICYGGDGSLWVKTDLAYGTTGWLRLIAPTP